MNDQNSMNDQNITRKQRILNSHTLHIVAIAILLIIAAATTTAAVIRIVDRSSAKRTSEASTLLAAEPEAQADSIDTGSAKTAQVVIEKGDKALGSFAVTPGTSVVWRNNDTVPHTISGDTIGSNKVEPGATFSYTFDQIGDYSFRDGSREGTIVVRE